MNNIMLKHRFASVIITLISIAIFYWTRHSALHNEGYYLKAVAFAPLGIVGGIFLIFFPQFYGKPETGREKAAALTVFCVGVLLGLYNWYSIDPQMFKF